MEIGNKVIIHNSGTSYDRSEGKIVHLKGKSMFSDELFDFGVQFCKDGWIVGFKEEELTPL